jgi:hypothetical protein
MSISPAENKKDAAVYHSIMAEMHRLRSLLLNLQTIDLGSTEEAVRSHLSREQSIVLGKLTEWRQHRPHIYREAETDFQRLYAGPNAAEEHAPPDSG